MEEELLLEGHRDWLYILGQKAGHGLLERLITAMLCESQVAYCPIVPNSDKADVTILTNPVITLLL